MMLDRLRVADLKDEIVSMQADLNSVLFEQHQKSQVKSEAVSNPPIIVSHHQPVPQISQIPQIVQSLPQQQPLVSQPPQASPKLQQSVQILHEPSQILKAKQELKLFENIKNERVKIELPKEPNRNIQTYPPSLAICSMPQMLKSPNPSQVKQSKFDFLKNESKNIVINSHHVQQPQTSSHNISKVQPLPQLPVKPSVEMKQELDDFDIESEIRPNLIMKKCETAPIATSSQNVVKKVTKHKEREREFSPLSDYFSMKATAKSKESLKNETSDGTFDEWLSIQKELNLQLTIPPSSSSKKKDSNAKPEKHQLKSMDNDLSEIFENHTSPKSVEKQLDDLFSSASKSSDLLAAPSPLTEFFDVEPSNLSEKTVENRLEALFRGAEDDSGKSNQQDLVETRLEQLFQGSVAENDESALDNASFLYKNPDLTYDMIQKQIQVSNDGSGAASNPNKRQWSGACDMFASNNSSILFPASSSPSSSKRTCTVAPSVAFDNKWIEDSFDFATDIMSTEASNDKHQSWDGGIEHRETMIGGIPSPQNHFHLPNDDSTNIQHHQNVQNVQDHLMDHQQIPNLNYDDVDDISRQVQNAIDSILNLQSSDPLHYQLDSSFLELNAITAPSSSTTMNQQHLNQNQVPHHQQQQQYSVSRPEQHMNSVHMSNPKLSNMPKRKYSRMDDIGDCLIGGSNLDDSPSALVLPESQVVESASGDFVNNMLSCEEKSIAS